MGESELPSIDYRDRSVVDVADASERDALAWARAMLEDAPAGTRQTLDKGWKALQIRRGPVGAPDHVLGWPVLDAAPGRAVLGSTSRLGFDVRLVFETDDRSVTMSTLMKYTSPLGRLVWAGIAPGHRRVVPALLRSAVKRSSGGQPG
jgi:hypothetical protein